MKIEEIKAGDFVSTPEGKHKLEVTDVFGETNMSTGESHRDGYVYCVPVDKSLDHLKGTYYAPNLRKWEDK